MQLKRCNRLVTLGRTLADAENQSGDKRRDRIAGLFHGWFSYAIAVVQKYLPDSESGFVTFHLDHIAQVG